MVRASAAARHPCRRRAGGPATPIPPQRARFRPRPRPSTDGPTNPPSTARPPGSPVRQTRPGPAPLPRSPRRPTGAARVRPRHSGSHSPSRKERRGRRRRRERRHHGGRDGWRALQGAVVGVGYAVSSPADCPPSSAALTVSAGSAATATNERRPRRAADTAPGHTSRPLAGGRRSRGRGASVLAVLPVHRFTGSGAATGRPSARASGGLARSRTSNGPSHPQPHRCAAQPGAASRADDPSVPATLAACVRFPRSTRGPVSGTVLAQTRPSFGRRTVPAWGRRLNLLLAACA